MLLQMGVNNRQKGYRSNDVSRVDNTHSFVNNAMEVCSSQRSQSNNNNASQSNAMNETMRSSQSKHNPKASM